MEIIGLMDDTSPETETPEKRAVGRPKGLPKTGGRPKGAKGKLPEEFRRFIDQRGRPLEFLAAISRGNMVTAADPADPTKKTRVYPSLRERTLAAQSLLDRLLPTLKSQEVSGPAGGPVEVQAAPISAFDLARRVAFMLAEAAHDNPSAEVQAAAEAAASCAMSLSGGASGSARPEAPARSQVLDAKQAPILATVEAEVVEAPRLRSQAVADAEFAEVVSDARNRMKAVIRIAERMADGRARYEATRPDNGLSLGSSFDLAELRERFAPAPPPWEAARDNRPQTIVHIRRPKS